MQLVIMNQFFIAGKYLTFSHYGSKNIGNTRSEHTICSTMIPHMIKLNKTCKYRRGINRGGLNFCHQPYRFYFTTQVNPGLGVRIHCNTSILHLCERSFNIYKNTNTCTGTL